MPLGIIPRRQRWGRVRNTRDASAVRHSHLSFACSAQLSSGASAPLGCTCMRGHGCRVHPLIRLSPCRHCNRWRGPRTPRATATRTRMAMLAGYVVHAERPTGDKVTRARPFAAQVEAGNVALVRGAWNLAYLDELGLVPNGRYWDQTDASAGAFAKLATVRQVDQTPAVGPARWPAGHRLHTAVRL